MKIVTQHVCLVSFVIWRFQKWPCRGPITSMFWRYLLACGVPFPAKIRMVAYLCTYISMAFAFYGTVGYLAVSAVLLHVRPFVSGDRVPLRSVAAIGFRLCSLLRSHCAIPMPRFRVFLLSFLVDASPWVLYVMTQETTRGIVGTARAIISLIPEHVSTHEACREMSQC